jgi:hypothetical protein
MMSVKRRLLGLAAGHLVVGIIAALLAPIELPDFFLCDILVVPLFASARCQALLLALWGSTSRGSPWRRMPGLIAGVVYLEALFPSTLRQRLPGMGAVMVTFALAALLVVWRLGVRLIRFADPAHPVPPETVGFRFSIRGLMLVIAAAALLSAGARALREAPAFFVLAWPIRFVAVGLVALWAVLGVGRPLRRAPIVFVLSLILGALFGFAVQAEGPGWVDILLMMLLYPTLLFGSLLVVRSCGYRFVRRVISSSKPPDEHSESLPLETSVTGVTAAE